MNVLFLEPPSNDTLRDVHLPPSPSWWPPAPGWWVVFVVVCIVLLAFFLIVTRRHHHRLQRKQILAELEGLATRHSDDVAYATSLHQLLRRAARRYATDAHLLQGARWREVLARVPVDSATLDKLMTLDARMYQPRADFNRTDVQLAAHRWLETALRLEKRIARGTAHA
jgi:hypothetical protein